MKKYTQGGRHTPVSRRQADFGNGLAYLEYWNLSALS